MGSRGPKPKDPAARQSVPVRVGLTIGEAARLDAARGIDDRAAYVRAAVLAQVRRDEAAQRRVARSSPAGKCATGLPRTDCLCPKCKEWRFQRAKVA